MSEARHKAQQAGFRNYLVSGTREFRKQPGWCERKDCEFMPLRRTETGELVDEWQHYGRCGHSRSCGYDRRPKKKEWIAPLARPIPTVQKPKRKKQTKFAEIETVASTMVAPSVMQSFLHFFAGESSTAQWTNDGCMIGASPSNPNETIYWYATRELRFCTAKVVEYQQAFEYRFRRKDTLKRNKKGTHYQAHKKLGLDYSPILYGLPYIQPLTSVVNIVESEKTAEMMRLTNYGMVWLATGGKSNLREEVLRDVSEFAINLWPDQDAASNWLEFANRWNGRQDDDNGNTYRIRVVNWQSHCVERVEPTDDPSDWMQVANLSEWDTVKQLQEWK